MPNVFEDFYRYMTSSRLVSSYEVWKTLLPQPPASFDMSSVCKSTWRHNPEAFNLPQHCFEDLKSCVVASLEVVVEMKYMAGWRVMQVDNHKQQDGRGFNLC